MLPAGANGPAFLVTKNFDVVYSYNAAESYSLAACVLADRLSGGPGIADALADRRPGLSRAARRELQALLARHGSTSAQPDGAIRNKTKEAIADFQGSGHAGQWPGLAEGARGAREVRAVFSGFGHMANSIAVHRQAATIDVDSSDSAAARIGLDRISRCRRSWSQAHGVFYRQSLDMYLPLAFRRLGCDVSGMQNAKPGSHTIWDCKCRLVWITKYRFPVFGGDVGNGRRELSPEIAGAHEMSIYAGAINRDHVHMLDRDTAAVCNLWGNCLQSLKGEELPQTAVGISVASQTVLGSGVFGVGAIGFPRAATLQPTRWKSS